MNNLFSKNSYSSLSDGLYAEVETSKGNILLKLFFERAPLTVANFVGLSEGELGGKNKPFYDGLTFHRVVPNFVIQGGDPEGTGRGGPGYSFSDEFHPELRHDEPGILSMANSGPNSNGSQFFITLDQTAWLDDKHSIFGQVIQGMDVVQKIAEGDQIKKVVVIRRGEKAGKFKVSEKSFNELEKKVKEENEKKLEKQLSEYFKTTFDESSEIEKTKEGIYYQIVREGQGSTAPAGSKVEVHYRGSFPGGREFDSSYSRNQTFSFTLGAGQVIPGWDLTLSDMKKGEKRIILLPPELAYGDRGAGGVIPPNAFLVFEVELIDF